MLPDYIVHDSWELAKMALLLIIYLAVAYGAIRIFHGTLHTLFMGMGAEIRSLLQLTPSPRGMNALFGILVFVAIIFIFAAVEIAEAQQREIGMPGPILLLIGAFLLIIFVSLSVAYCARAED
jgi:hypothetical protein